jgi:natural product precursor
LTKTVTTEKELVMRKKDSKKLTLHRETVAHLDRREMRVVQGGDTCNATASCPPPTTRPTCSDLC